MVNSQKIIIVKSALTVQNKLFVPVEIMAVINDKQFNLTTLSPGAFYHVPLPMVTGDLFCRPVKTLNCEYQYCYESLKWRSVFTAEEKGLLYECESVTKPLQIFRYYFAINLLFC